VSLDFLALPPTTHCGEELDQILVFTDRLSKFVVAVPCRKAGMTSEMAAAVLVDRVVCLFGCPSQLISDRDHLFTANVWRAVCGILGIEMRMGVPHRARANGQAERTNKELIKLLRCLLLDGGDGTTGWPTKLAMAVFMINSTTSSATRTSPLEAMLGRMPVGFGDQAPWPLQGWEYPEWQ
jgi:hypothetical protein